MLLVLRLAFGSRGGSWWTWIARGLAALGGIVGVVSALEALVQVGGTAPYSGRLAFGILALLCAVVAGIAPHFAGSRRVAASVLIVCGLVGGIAINLFYINTFYLVAVLLWWLAAFLLVLVPSKPATRSSTST